MKRMTILNQYNEQIQIGTTFGYEGFRTIVLSFLALLLFSCFVTIWVAMIKEKEYGGWGWTFAMLILVVLCVGAGWFNTPVYKEIPTYEAILSEDYPAKELLDKYDVIEIKGQIYVIQEKGEMPNG